MRRIVYKRNLLIYKRKKVVFLICFDLFCKLKRIILMLRYIWKEWVFIFFKMEVIVNRVEGEILFLLLWMLLIKFFVVLFILGIIFENFLVLVVYNMMILLILLDFLNFWIFFWIFVIIFCLLFVRMLFVFLVWLVVMNFGM